jgi:hypothetical protein
MNFRDWKPLPRLDDEDDYDTLPLEPLADDAPTETENHIARLLGMGFREYEDLVDAKGNDDGQQL